MRRAFRPLCLLLLFTVVAPPCSVALGQEPPDEQENSSATIQSLERRVRELEATIRGLQIGSPGQSPNPVSVRQTGAQLPNAQPAPPELPSDQLPMPAIESKTDS